jgi:acyl dehydratase
MFPNPTYVGEEATIRLEVTRVQPTEKQADLTTVILLGDGRVGLQGRTLVRLLSTTRPAMRFTGPAHQPTEHADSKSLRGLEIGQRAETSRAFGAQDLAEYADLTGDTNPIFTDVDCARRLGLTGLKRPMVPGALLGGLFSYLLGTRLPGKGTNYLKQRLAFPKPAYQDQQLTASVEIIRIRPEKQLVNLSTLCVDPSGDVVCQGEALVLVRDVRIRES